MCLWQKVWQVHRKVLAWKLKKLVQLFSMFGSHNWPSVVHAPMTRLQIVPFDEFPKFTLSQREKEGYGGMKNMHDMSDSRVLESSRKALQVDKYQGN